MPDYVLRLLTYMVLSEKVLGIQQYYDCNSCSKGTSGNKAEYRVESKQANASISSLMEQEIFCRKKEKIENLSFFERLEVLYEGAYFGANVFREYGNAGLSLKKKEIPFI